jgi:hypothetical protein
LIVFCVLGGEPRGSAEEGGPTLLFLGECLVSIGADLLVNGVTDWTMVQASCFVKRLYGALPLKP